MKRVDLLKKIRESGAVLVRHGGKHDWYSDPDTGTSQSVPRHREIKDVLAKRIIKQLGPAE